jgi:hypothetical protein
VKTPAWIAVLIAAASLGGGGDASAFSELAEGGSSASARLAFSIRIPPLLRLRSTEAGAVVELPASGSRVVEVSRAATLEVQSNLRAGYELRFEIRDPDVEAVEIAGLGQPVSLTPGGRSVRFGRIAASDATRRHVLHYTIRYTQGARPGPRVMPVAYSVSAGA